MNPWHDVKIGAQSPDLIPAIIEVPKGKKTIVESMNLYKKTFKKSKAK